MTADIPTITTPRLILRPLELSDADAVQDIFPQWEIVRYLANKVPWPYHSRHRASKHPARHRLALVDPTKVDSRTIDRRDQPAR